MLPHPAGAADAAVGGAPVAPPVKLSGSRYNQELGEWTAERVPRLLEGKGGKRQQMPQKAVYITPTSQKSGPAKPHRAAPGSTRVLQKQGAGAEADRSFC